MEYGSPPYISNSSSPTRDESQIQALVETQRKIVELQLGREYVVESKVKAKDTLDYDATEARFRHIPVLPSTHRLAVPKYTAETTKTDAEPAAVVYKAITLVFDIVSLVSWPDGSTAIVPVQRVETITDADVAKFQFLKTYPLSDPVAPAGLVKGRTREFPASDLYILWTSADGRQHTVHPSCEVVLRSKSAHPFQQWSVKTGSSQPNSVIVISQWDPRLALRVASSGLLHAHFLVVTKGFLW